MTNKQEMIRQMARKRRREQRRKQRHKRNVVLGVATLAVLLVTLRFAVKKWNDNTSAMSARYIESTSPYQSPSKAETSQQLASAEANEGDEASPQIAYLSEEEVERIAPPDRTAKNQVQGFQDVLDGFLVTKEDAVLYNRNSAKSMEVAILPQGTYVETFGEEEGWTKVASGNQQGYIRNRQLEVVTDGSLFKVVKGKIIVNRTYGVASTYKAVFNEEAAAALRVMLEAMDRAGVQVEVGAQVRDASEEAKELVLMGNPENAPEPGHSVFQTGYGVQFYAPGTDPRMDNQFDKTEQFAWLKEHAAEYGFILRYPQGSEAITGYRADPTIYYYVGVEDATAMRDAEQTMEEYYGVE